MYTEHIWEDFFITFRHSENLCQGQGLVYNPGEKIHGFTSPIGVLLPALCHIVTGKVSYVYALALFRILSVFALMGACYFCMRFFKIPLQSRLIAIFLILDVKSIAFSVNGMETAFMLLFLSWWLSLEDIEKHWGWGGICWGMLMWTRPDSCVYIFIFALSSVVFSENRKTTFYAILKIAGVCTIIYLPWFIWAFWYYGTPIPHTVSAKSPISLGQHFYELAVNFYWEYPYCLATVFGPIYDFFGPWFPWVFVFPYFMGTFASLFWIFPSVDKRARIISFSFFLLCLYLCYMPIPYPWYTPPVAMCGYIVFIEGSFLIAKKLQKSFKHSFTVVRYLHLLVIVWLFVMYTLISFQIKIQQQQIENGNRTQIGLWLKQNTQPQDTIYLECLGYIGYFSETHVLDFPGLVTPQVVALRKQGYSFVGIIQKLQPDWVVMRPSEASLMKKEPKVYEYIQKNYKIAEVFDCSGKINRYPFLPGRKYLLHDSIFVILKHHPPVK